MNIDAGKKKIQPLLMFGVYLHTQEDNVHGCREPKHIKTREVYIRIGMDLLHD